ncbi:MAG: phosphoribosyl-AMP cyclohydrolase, partial [Sphaerospermopsis kisseleviana]
MILPSEMIRNLKFNSQGLIPAIAQDYRDGTILMMAWMNAESIQKT